MPRSSATRWSWPAATMPARLLPPGARSGPRASPAGRRGISRRSAADRRRLELPQARGGNPVQVGLVGDVAVAGEIAVEAALVHRGLVGREVIQVCHVAADAAEGGGAERSLPHVVDQVAGTRHAEPGRRGGWDYPVDLGDDALRG